MIGASRWMRAAAVRALPAVRPLLAGLTDALLPPRCLACRAITQSGGQSGAGLCPRCWSSFRFIGAPICGSCGVPLSVDLGREAVCGACAVAMPPYGRARAALVYDDASRPLILAFKHADRTDFAPTFARWMIAAGGDVLAGADLLVPVPLHWSRLFTRTYNQAGLLANRIGNETGVAVAHDLLIRRKRTPKLGTMSASERSRTLNGVIAVRSGRAAAIAARRIVIVDDVLTSGATVGACAKRLRAAGAARVDVLALARTMRDRSAA